MVEAIMLAYALYMGIELVLFGKRRGNVSTKYKALCIVLVLWTTCALLGALDDAGPNALFSLVLFSVFSLILTIIPRVKAIIIGGAVAGSLLYLEAPYLFMWLAFSLLGTFASYLMQETPNDSKTTK